MEARSVLKKMVSKLWNYDVGAHCLFNINSQARDSYFHEAEIPSAREHIFSRALAPPSRLNKSWGYLFQMIGRMSCQLLAALPLSDPLLTVLFPQTTNQIRPLESTYYSTIPAHPSYSSLIFASHFHPSCLHTRVFVLPLFPHQDPLSGHTFYINTLSSLPLHTTQALPQMLLNVASWQAFCLSTPKPCVPCSMFSQV